MIKPLIGLTTTFSTLESKPPTYGTNKPYADAVLRAGGLPVLIPNDLSNSDLDLLIQRLDGILFTGGYDMEPSCYAHPPHPAIEQPDADRDRVEIHLVHSAVQHGLPFFGICRGMQVINVALGGSLYEHLPDQLPANVHLENHDKPRHFLAHPVTIQPTNQLAEIFRPGETWVNSLHHQGVSRSAQGLRVTALAPDGLVEAFELPGHPCGLAVQWHPEELQEDPSMRMLFEFLVQACQERVRA